MADTEMAKMFGIPVDDRDKEKGARTPPSSAMTVVRARF
jgi:hypothetical protein